MSADRWVLAIDLGNGGPKVAVVDAGGNLRSVAFRPVSVHIGLDGAATQDADEWWSTLVEASRDAIANGNVEAAAAEAIAITGQWGSTVPVDAAGRPVGEVLLWADTRGGKYVRDVIGGPVSFQGYAPQRVLPWIRTTGGAPTPSGADPTGHSLLLQREMRAVYDRAAFLLEPVDFLGARFTGRIAATPASMTGSWVTRNRLHEEPVYDQRLVRWSKRDAAKLPPLVPTGSVLGGVLPDVADEFGIPAGVPVVCGTPDLLSAVIGSGAVEPYATHVTISTTAWVGARVPFKKTDILHSIATVPGFDNDFPVVANNHETGGAALRWLREQVLPDESYDDLVTKAEGAPAGSEGVLFTPWLNGERSPVDDKRLRASFLNISLRTDQATLIRSVMEGVAFNARWLFDYYEKFLGRRVPSVRIIGGGAQSDLWCQLHAYALDRPVERPADPRDAQLKGAAAWARVCLGEMTLEQAGRQAIVTDTFLPDGPDAAVYRALYPEFRRLYRTLKKTHQRLGRLNGT
ncbi:MAG: FGGY-family carbohydrate kinase [Actinobacteria bacterium]|jgi:xylulokinase|nr:FGGY-family carbohydrate kinase [Actinomycetota bacterium]